jgi:hypothetical protein
VVLPAVPNTNRSSIENLFLISRPPALPTHGAAEGSAVQPTFPGNVFRPSVA